MRITGCNPVSPWKCAVVWGLLGLASGFSVGTAVLEYRGLNCPAPTLLWNQPDEATPAG